jgi:DNA adenine methylase
MKTASPLRYPGGKSAMASLLAQIRKLNGVGARSIAEPFAGGAGASLTLLFLEETHEIFINDADQAIYSFWWSLLNRPKLFSEMLATTSITMNEWYRQRAIYRAQGRRSRLRHGFSAFYLNRSNRSGIIMNGGPIGGIEQNGEWKLDARFNILELQRRCNKVAEYRDRIHLTGMDGIELIECLDLQSTFLFIDPPSFEKGWMVYLTSWTQEYHTRLALRLRSIEKAAWVLTYDDCPEIRRLYGRWASVRPFSLRYAAATRRSGNELLITPKWIRLPTVQSSAAIKW